MKTVRRMEGREREKVEGRERKIADFEIKKDFGIHMLSFPAYLNLGIQILEENN